MYYRRFLLWMRKDRSNGEVFIKMKERYQIIKQNKMIGLKEILINFYKEKALYLSRENYNWTFLSLDKTTKQIPMRPKKENSQN